MNYVLMCLLHFLKSKEINNAFFRGLAKKYILDKIQLEN